MGAGYRRWSHLAMSVVTAGALLTPSIAAGYSSSTGYSSLAEMPPAVRALFIGVGVLVGLGLLAGVVGAVRKGRSGGTAGPDGDRGRSGQ